MAATDFVTEAQVDSLVTNVATAVKANTTAHTTHTGLATGAHAASAISVADVATQLTAVDVEAALAEIMDYAQTKTDDSALSTHTGLATDAHAASAVSVLDTGLKYTATDVEAALAEVKTLADDAATSTALTTHTGAAAGAHAASAISIVDAGAIFTATEVEAALQEVKLIADAAGGGVTINDVGTSTTSVWSSSKTNTEIDTAVSDLVDSAPGTLDTLNELAAALGDDPNFATTTATALGFRLRFDAAQTLDGTQMAQALTNLGIVASTVNFAANFNTAIA